MSALDKSLDEIIKSSRKARKVGGPKKTAPTKKVGAGVTKKAKIVGSKAPKKAPVVLKKAKVADNKPGFDLTYATKVVVSGLPRDIKIDGIRDFFNSQVGGVQSLSLTYNEKGQFKGIATIIFRNHKSAALAVQKYNGAPIDGGSSKLTLELIIDPTKKPLATRIVANSISSKPAAKANKSGASIKGNANKKAPAGANTKKPVANKQAKAADKKKKGLKANKAKKTVEQLDQEMADYFETKP